MREMKGKIIRRLIRSADCHARVLEACLARLSSQDGYLFDLNFSEQAPGI